MTAITDLTTVTEITAGDFLVLVQSGVTKNGTVAQLNALIDSTVTVSNTAPSTPASGRLWADNTTTTWVIKMFDGTDWIVLFDVDITANTTNLPKLDEANTFTSTLSASNLSGTNTGDEVASSATVSGVIELATQVEVDAGSDTLRAVTPATLTNLPIIAATSGTNTGDEVAASETLAGVVERATDVEVVTGTDTTRYITSKQLADNVSLVFLSEQVISTDTSIDFTTATDFNYTKVIFELVNVTPTTTSTLLNLLMSTDGGATFNNAASDYDYATTSTDATEGTASVRNSATASVISLCGGDLQLSNNSVGMNATVDLYDPSATGIFKYMKFAGAYIMSGSILTEMHGAGIHLKNSLAVNGIRFIQSSGTLKAGTIRMYGVV